MSSILVTGSTQGIGLETASKLVSAGHRVVLHARDEEKARQVRDALPGAAGVLTGDLSSLTETKDVARQSVDQGPFDVVVHNAGIGGGIAERQVTADGLELIFQVNVVAPYLLTVLMPQPTRLVYLTSGLQDQGNAHWEDLQFVERPWDGMEAYSDSKMYDVMLALAVARLWPDSVSNAVDPGWVKTRLGGPAATDDLNQGTDTQLWLATSDDPAALETGRYLKHRQVLTPNPAAADEANQARLLTVLADLTGVTFPAE